MLTQLVIKLVKPITVERTYPTKNTRNTLCKLFGHCPMCHHCDPDGETTFLLDHQQRKIILIIIFLMIDLADGGAARNKRQRLEWTTEEKQIHCALATVTRARMIAGLAS